MGVFLFKQDFFDNQECWPGFFIQLEFTNVDFTICIFIGVDSSFCILNDAELHCIYEMTWRTGVHHLLVKYYHVCR